MKKLLKHFTLFGIGGLSYIGVELLWRGYTHWTMFLLGAMCFVALGIINEVIPWSMSITTQALIGALFITTLEFIFGVILNIWLELGVWDYTNVPYNLLGQCCLAYSIGWVGLSIIGIVLDDYLRYWWFHEEKPHYTL